MAQNIIDILKEKASGLTEVPGVYLMKNKDGKIIYVGKAINLKRRVLSYFQNIDRHDPKTAALVSLICDFHVMVTQNELEALLLENNLIKHHKPKYNILLKDDKGISYLKITFKDDYPMLMLVRNRINDGAAYFGPYIASWSARNSLEAARNAFSLPRCSNPSPKKGARPCMYHRINRCMGVCAGNITKEEYRDVLEKAAAFLAGDVDGVISQVKAQMERAADNLDFEKAARLRDCIKSLDTSANRQRVVSGPRLNADYIGFAEGKRRVCLYVLSVRRGVLAGSRQEFYPAKYANDQAALTAEYIKRLYSVYSSDIPSKCCTFFEIPDNDSICEYLSYLKGGSFRISVPKSGKDLELLNMAKTNAKEHLILEEGKAGRTELSLMELSKLMEMDAPFEWAEIYDISQIKGTYAVCGMAVFRKGQPEKNKYKRFKITTINAGDDPASLKEAVSRRLERFESNDQSFMPLPDCIIVDGGQAQVSAVLSLISGKYNIPVFGLKKDSRHRTKSLVLTDGREIPLKDHPNAFRLAGTMQEEAHRFAIAYHRSIMTHRAYQSELLKIKGIGKSSAAAIMKHFKTMTALQRADIEELCGIPGISEQKALYILDYLKENQI